MKKKTEPPPAPSGAPSLPTAVIGDRKFQFLEPCVVRGLPAVTLAGNIKTRGDLRFNAASVAEFPGLLQVKQVALFQAANSLDLAIFPSEAGITVSRNKNGKYLKISNSALRPLSMKYIRIKYAMSALTQPAAGWLLTAKESERHPA